MAVISISSDEWYPVYSFDRKPDGWGVKREVPEEKIERWERVMQEFDQIQIEMNDFVEKGSDVK